MGREYDDVMTVDSRSFDVCQDNFYVLLTKEFSNLEREFLQVAELHVMLEKATSQVCFLLLTLLLLVLSPHSSHPFPFFLNLFHRITSIYLCGQAGKSRSEVTKLEGKLSACKSEKEVLSGKVSIHLATIVLLSSSPRPALETPRL